MTYIPEMTAERRQVKIKTWNRRLMVMMLLVQVSLEHWLICTVGYKLSTDCFQVIISYFSHFVVTFIWWWRKVIEHLLPSDLLWKTKSISNKHPFLWRVRFLFVKILFEICYISLNIAFQFQDQEVDNGIFISIVLIHRTLQSNLTIFD